MFCWKHAILLLESRLDFAATSDHRDRYAAAGESTGAAEEACAGDSGRWGGGGVISAVMVEQSCCFSRVAYCRDGQKKVGRAPPQPWSELE